MHYLVRLVATMLMCILVLPLIPANAAENEVIRDFGSSVEVRSDGSMLVREKITVVAAHKQINYGIYRDFPLGYSGPKRYSGEVPFQVESVTLDGVTLDVNDIQKRTKRSAFSCARRIKSSPPANIPLC